MHTYREIFLIALLVAACLTPIVRLLAFRLNLLDHPKAHGIHSHPVPRIGGVAIFLGFVIGALWTMDLSHQLKGVLVASTIIFVTGLIDDFIHLKAKVRLLIQTVALCIMMFRYDVMLNAFPHPALNAFFTALGIIGITNAVNFLDNMDGLSSGLIAISSAAVFWVAYSTGQVWLGYLAVALVGTACGFLFFNLRKAHVFMGDSGATFLGFTLASITVMADWSQHLTVTLAVPVLILGVPILDMILITVLRMKEDKVKTVKQWIDYTGKDHFSHRVMRLGLGDKGTVFAVWAVQAAFCALALFIFPRTSLYGWIGIGAYALVTGGVILFFRKRRMLLLNMNGRSAKKRSSYRPAPEPEVVEVEEPEVALKA